LVRTLQVGLQQATPILGTCFDGWQCKNTYIDLGPVSKNGKHIVWVFQSPDPNSLDTEGNYSPNRLQNNVFGGGGRIWPVWTVVSGTLDLYASTDGTTKIFSTVRGPDPTFSRDLTLMPFTSEEEILHAADIGFVVINDEGFSADCPITRADPGDIVVDLNPDVFELCSRTKQILTGCSCTTKFFGITSERSL
jgi:hypothetical protein